MGNLLVLKNSDVMHAHLDPARVIDLVEASIADLALGNADNPPKVAITPEARKMAISMLGRLKKAGTIGFKSYAEIPVTADRVRIESTITLIEDATGHPFAFMDCEWITAARTSAVTGIFARYAAHSRARRVLILGSGQQARHTVAVLTQTMPQLEEIVIHARRRSAVAEIIQAQSGPRTGCRLAYCADPAEGARGADIVVGASGAGTPDLVRKDMLRPGALVIYVGHGIAGDALHGADRVIATSEAQMQVTGQDLLDGYDRLPAVHAELPDILIGRKPARLGDNQIIAAYNSGLTVTDIALATAVYETARQHAVGNLVVGF